MCCEHKLKELPVIEIDTHVHTISSVHAYNTINECAYWAKRNGIKILVITDHFGPYFLNGNLFQHYASICNLRHIDENIYGIKFIVGIEIDIIDKYGNLAFNNQYFPFDRNENVCAKLLNKVKIVIASYHAFDFENSTDENTEMLLNVVQNPKVNILGHCDRIKNKFDMDVVIPDAVKNKKIIELNCASLEGDSKMADSLKRLAVKCAEYNALVSIGSDAHFAYKIGDFNKMLQMLNSIQFPIELIINTTEEKFLSIIN